MLIIHVFTLLNGRYISRNICSHSVKKLIFDGLALSGEEGGRSFGSGSGGFWWIYMVKSDDNILDGLG